MYAPSYVLRRIITALEQAFPNESIDQWFEDAKVITLADDTLVLYSPYLSSHNQILTKCVPYMTNVLNQLLKCQVQLFIWSDKELQEDLCPKSHLAHNDITDTFDKFVISGSNSDAVTMARAVVNCEDQQFVPLLIIHGPSGVGKTHLLKAIKHLTNTSYPSKVVHYLTPDHFTNELILRQKQGRYESFIQQYHSLDLLLIDDIQFLRKKEATQEEFFRLIAHLYQNRKQVVITSNCPPTNIPYLNDCLNNHFNSFTVTSIGLPDFKILYTIATRISEQYNLPLDQPKTRYIAESCPANVRHLMGILKKLRAIYELDGKELSIENIDAVIKSY